MQISKTIETEEGTIKFEGELSQDEADLVMKVGLNVLFHQGALPFKVADGDVDIDDADEDNPQ